ncbi:MAG: amino acid permease [Planctomycetes bacterium]|nr:amino acid permease [Planctomycetota bacterium]
MFWKSLFATKSLEMLQEEAAGENRLRRILGPIGLTSLGVGAIIGAGIFVMTGRVAAEDSGPGVMLSYAVAGLGCALAAFCYAEFAAMAPVAGSAYTYAFATLGELFAWIIGWDLILEYAMSGATVASGWSEYFNKLTSILFNWQFPDALSNDPFTSMTLGQSPWSINLLAVGILAIVTVILVIGIRESAFSNTLLVLTKLGVVIFIICVGAGYIISSNWTQIPPQERKTPEEWVLSDAIKDYVADTEKMKGDEADKRVKLLTPLTMGVYTERRVETIRKELSADNLLTPDVEKRLTRRVYRAKLELDHKDSDGEEAKKTIERTLAIYSKDLQGTAKELDASLAKLRMQLPAANSADRRCVEGVLADAKELAKKKAVEKWGLIAEVGLNEYLVPLDESTRSNFTPYGLSGIMLGAALVFFAFIGFDSISTHAEEAKRPQRDVPFGIIASLFICTILYMGVSAVITGMQPYPDIDTKAAIAAAFEQRALVEDSGVLKAAAALIAVGGLAGMTSVLLITFLSQARIFLAISRDGLLPQKIFASIHPKFRTPHISTIVTGAITAVVAALTPIQDLEKMVNIGTLFAFIVVCAAVLMLRVKRPDAHRPFRCPIVFILAPLGIFVNLLMALFLPIATWLRLILWLALGLVIYFSFGYGHSILRKKETAT